jgi:tudor domain-containing protein 3
MAVDILGQTWSISQKGQDIITENNTVNDKATLLKNALNSDLKEIGSPVLAKNANKANISQVVLQIQKIRNVSAPKANENSQAAPRMLKLMLTDGDTYIQAVETAPIPSLNRDKTPPGSKLLIHSAKICSGYVLLDSSNCSLLGGQVPALCEKWELAKSVKHQSRQNASSDGPPAWVNFGGKIQVEVQDKQFKSLETKSQEAKENSKFDLQRQDAIAEAASGAVKKVFGGGSKQPVQPAFNPRAKKSNEFPVRDKRNMKMKTGNGKEMEEKLQKPLEKVSLFDFLEDKLPPNENPGNDISQEPFKPHPNNNIQRNTPTNYQNNRYHNPYVNAKVTGNNSEYQNNSSRWKSGAYPNKQAEKDKPEKNPEINGLSNSFGKMSLNSQFASRSLKQHLNLGPQKKNNAAESVNTSATWKVGDDCVAKYWEDGKYYNANITAVTDTTCVVKFKGYGNIEEVLKTDCLPVSSEANKKSHYTGPMEFRRNTRTYRRQ